MKQTCCVSLTSVCSLTSIPEFFFLLHILYNKRERSLSGCRLCKHTKLGSSLLTYAPIPADVSKAIFKFPLRGVFVSAKRVLRPPDGLCQWEPAVASYLPLTMSTKLKDLTGLFLFFFSVITVIVRGCRHFLRTVLNLLISLIGKLQTGELTVAYSHLNTHTHTHLFVQ